MVAQTQYGEPRFQYGEHIPMRRCDSREMMILSRRLTRKESKVLHIQEKLVESIQSDRRREVEAARLVALSDTTAAPRRRLFVVPSIFTNGMTTTRTTAHHTAMATDKSA